MSQNEIHLVRTAKEVERSAGPADVDAAALVIAKLDDIECAAAERHDELMRALAERRERILRD